MLYLCFYLQLQVSAASPISPISLSELLRRVRATTPLLLSFDIFAQYVYRSLYLFDRYLCIALHIGCGELYIGLADKFSFANGYHLAIIGEGHRLVVLLAFGKNT